MPVAKKKRARRVRRVENLENFIRKQLTRYIRIHKRHEKEINYIG